jgi:hypothetical protein
VILPVAFSGTDARTNRLGREGHCRRRQDVLHLRHLRRTEWLQRFDFRHFLTDRGQALERVFEVRHQSCPNQLDAMPGYALVASLMYVQRNQRIQRLLRELVLVQQVTP